MGVIAVVTIGCSSSDDKNEGEKLSVSPDTISLSLNTKGTLTVSGGKSPYSVSSMNTSIASVSFNGNTVTVSGIGEGTTSIIITDSGSGSVTVNVTVKADTDTVSLKIKTFYETLDTPAGSNVLIKINNQDVGVTDKNGTLEISVKTGNLDIRAVEPGIAGGRERITVSKGENRFVSIIMGSDGYLNESATLTIKEATSDNVISKEMKDFTLQFIKTDGFPVSLARLVDVIMYDVTGKLIVLTQFFTLQSDGSVRAAKIEEFKDVLFSVQTQKVNISVNGEDSQGLIYDGSVEFFIGIHTVKGMLLAPPSNPNLVVSNLSVNASLMGTDIKFNVISDSQGSFILSDIPNGILDFSINSESNGIIYTGSGTATIDGDKQVNITLLTTEDIINGVNGIEVINLSPSLMRKRTLRYDRNYQEQLIISDRSISRETSADDVAITVTASAENQQVTDKATLKVPVGTKTVVLKYTVSTVEYPQYVLSNSIYNDVWRIVVLSDKLLYAHKYYCKIFGLRIP